MYCEFRFCKRGVILARGCCDDSWKWFSGVFFEGFLLFIEEGRVGFIGRGSDFFVVFFFVTWDLF